MSDSSPGEVDFGLPWSPHMMNGILAGAKSMPTHLPDSRAGWGYAQESRTGTSVGETVLQAGSAAPGAGSGEACGVSSLVSLQL